MPAIGASHFLSAQRRWRDEHERARPGVDHRRKSRLQKQVASGNANDGKYRGISNADSGDQGETRVSESSFFADDGREQTTPNRVKTNEHAVAASGTTRGREQQKLGAESRTPNTDFWFYDADVELFADDDRDGYFHGIDLWFDAAYSPSARSRHRR